jgi:Mg-chelatase subunit ChlD
MTTTMDIAICFDCSLSISFYSKQIRRSILSILRHALLCDESDIRMALIEFQSHTDDWVTNIHPFTSSMDTFQQWINAVKTKGENLNECKAVGKKILKKKHIL